MQLKADLHTHSKHSDGDLSPVSLVKLAEKKGLDLISITDHDCIDAYFDKEFLAYKRKIKVITGIEFSCIYHGHYLDVLGYGFNPKKLYAILPKIEEHKRALDFGHALKVLKELSKLGYEISLENVPLSVQKVNYLIATVLQHYPKNRHLFLKRHGYEASHHAWYREYLRRGRAGDLPWSEDFIAPQIEAIKRAGGYAYLAHPRRLGYLATDKEIGELKKLGLTGIEVYYPGTSDDEIKQLTALAKKLRLGISGGSDFHKIGKRDLGSTTINSKLMNKSLLKKSI